MDQLKSDDHKPEKIKSKTSNIYVDKNSPFYLGSRISKNTFEVSEIDGPPLPNYNNYKPLNLKNLQNRQIGNF